MDFESLLVLLAMLTMIGALVFALVSKAKVERRMQDDDAPKSTLAKDKSSTGDPADV